MNKRLVYICSPCRGDYEKNKMEAECFCRIIMNHYPDVIPIAPHLYFPQFLDDNNPAERTLGMEAGLALLDICDELWVYGIQNPSEGMKAEIDRALISGIKIRDGFDHKNGAMQPEAEKGDALLVLPSRDGEDTVAVKLTRKTVYEMARTLKRKRGQDVTFEMRAKE